MAQDGRGDERLEVCIRYKLDYRSLELRHDVLLANNKLTVGLVKSATLPKVFCHICEEMLR